MSDEPSNLVAAEVTRLILIADCRLPIADFKLETLHVGSYIRKVDR